jgi:hypothetical protein
LTEMPMRSETQQLIEIGMLCAPCAGAIMQAPIVAGIDCRFVLGEMQMSDARTHHIVVEVDRDRFHSKLREIEAWLSEWEVDAEIGSVLGSTALLRVRFSDERAAYAFRRCFAGQPVPIDEAAAAQAADAADEDLYDRLAREYPD